MEPIKRKPSGSNFKKAKRFKLLKEAAESSHSLTSFFKPKLEAAINKESAEEDNLIAAIDESPILNINKELSNTTTSQPPLTVISENEPNPTSDNSTQDQTPSISSISYATESPDIGKLNMSSLNSLTDSERQTILTYRFIPNKSWIAPLRQIGKKKRRIQSDLFNSELFPTLRYSCHADGIYCAPCVLFQKVDIDSQLIRTPLIDWSNAKKVIDGHVSSKAHQTAVERATNFLKVCNGKKDDALSALSKAYKDKVQQNCLALTSITQTLVLCGRQNIAIRGHEDDRSNFMALLKFRAETDIALQKHLQSASNNATYISHSIQNELLDLCGLQIQNRVLSQCRKAGYFTVLADESADVSNSEQVAICLRFAPPPKFEVNEYFMSFVSTRETTGEILTQTILKQLQDFDLDLNKMVGQGYDGAGNMSGHIRGVQTRIREQYSMASYVHCRNHNLNLAISHSCKVIPIRNMYNIVGELLYFITASPQRLQAYILHATPTNAPLLKKFCETRWSHRSESVDQVIKCFKVILETLQYLNIEKAVKDSASFIRSILSFDFIICIHISSCILKYLMPLSNHMQAPNCDLVRASKQAQTLLSVLKSKRDDEAFYNKIWQDAIDLAHSIDVSPNAPRTARHQTQRSNTPASDTKDYWRLNAFLPFIDHIISQLDDRLCKPLPRLCAQYLLPEFLRQLTDEMWISIKEEYSKVLPMSETVDTELDTWRHYVNEYSTEAPRCLQSSVVATAGLYPNLHSILHTLLTMPVSTATAERSFSTLRRLKTYLRSVMTDSRLTSLALLHAHQDIIVDISDVIKQFDASGHRRIALAFE